MGTKPYDPHARRSVSQERVMQEIAAGGRVTQVSSAEKSKIPWPPATNCSTPFKNERGGK